MMTRSFVSLLPVLALLLTLAAPGSAQSLLGAGGLGIPAEPLDARSRALGMPGIGLSGWQLTPMDPGSSGGLFLPTITATFQPSVTTLDGVESGETRFPVIAVSYPYRHLVFSLQFGSFLEQGWDARVPRTVNLGGEMVDAMDFFEGRGGVGQARFAAGYRVVESLSVGASVGTYVGSIERRFGRQLDPTQVGPDVELYQIQGQWRASGLSITGGAVWDPSPLLRLGATLTLSDDLTLTPMDGTDGEARGYAIPMEVRAGGSFGLTPSTALVLGVTWADWAETGEALSGDGSRAGTWSYGGGIEFSGNSFRGRPLPLRVGVRERQLPFHFQGAEASERTYSGGFSLNIAQSEDLPVARIEFGLERGNRDAGALSEQFWRTTISVRLAGG